uniref:SRR1 domain-containing protein n=1 Tax=Globodera pallida TaxID=36090 RepID=A0A183BWE1_GLOPA
MDFNTPSRRSVASTNLRFGGTVHKPRWEKELEQKLQEVVDELLQNQQKTNVDEESGGYVKPISFDLFKELICAEAEEARIDGRFFDGRTVVSQSYDPYQTVFGHDDLRG